MDDKTPPMSRRDLLSMIGMAAGTTAMYAAMTELGHAAESTYTGPIKLSGDPKGASVLVLGAGLAGMTAALELRNAGYKVTLLEYQDRAGGRNWSIRGGDVVREIGSTQTCQFDKGLYLNPGPWRIPYHHHAIIDYCRRLKVPLEPFMQVNYNALIHSTKAFGGKPQPLRAITADFQGKVAELLAMGANKGMLDQAVTKEDQEILVEALRNWGALDKDYAYAKNYGTANRRGYERAEGGGPLGPVYSDPIPLHDVLQSGMWAYISQGFMTDHQSTIFQPVGGMGRIGDAFARELGPVIKLRCKVTEIKQDARGVTVSYVDTYNGGPVQTASADYCINAIPAPILSRMPMQISPAMRAAINSCAYSTNFKAGLQFKRKFWEEDEAIYGGITYTDLPISLIGYPNTDYAQTGKGILLGAYVGGRPATHEFTAMAPEERLKKIVAYGAQIHPQYAAEYENGVSVAWSRIPWITACLSQWTEERRAQHYQTMISFDGRMLLAGEHASYGIWQEHAILSGLNAVQTLHKRVTAA